MKASWVLTDGKPNNESAADKDEDEPAEKRFKGCYVLLVLQFAIFQKYFCIPVSFNTKFYTYLTTK